MADIKYHFIADGVQTVRDGFKSIGDEARSSSKAIEAGMRSIRTSNRIASQETIKQQKAESERAKVVESAIDIRRKQAEELAKRVAQDQAIQAKITASQQKEAVKRQKEAAKDIAKREALQARDRTNEQRHVERLNSIRDRQTQREERDKQKLQALENKHREKLESSKAKYDEIFQKRKDAIQESRAAEFKATARGAFIGGSAAIVASTLGIAGSAARQSLALHEVSNRLSISARGAGEEAVDPVKLRKEFEATAAKTPGISAIDIANAVQQFVSKTGELGVARKSQEVFATVASATGSNIADVSAAAADLFQKFDITTVEGMADAMSALAFQGKAGSFELKDAASQFAKLSAAAARFGLAKGAGGVRTLGGLTQIARSATGSPEQAATAVEAMFRQFTSSESLKELRSIKVDPFLDKGKTQTKEIKGLLVETITKAGGNLEKLQGIFGEEGIRAVSPIITEFNKAKQAASVGGASMQDANKAGETAARNYINKMIDAPGDYAELQRDAAQAQQDASAKLSNAWEKIVAGISDAAIPAITSFAETIENSPVMIEALIGTMENLIYFFGALVSATQDVLEYFGLVSKKTKSPEEKEAEARKKAKIAQDNLDRFDKKRGGSLDKVADLQIEAGKLRKEGKIKEAVAKEKEADAMYKKIKATPEQDAERLKLVGELEYAKKNVGRAHGEADKVRDQKQNIRSTDRFATEYAAMLDQTDPSNKGANLVRAKAVAAEMQRGAFGDSYLLKNEKMGNESDEAYQFRVNQTQARKESAGVALGKDTSDASPAQIAAAMAKVEAAAKAMETAANTIKGMGQASIVPQP